MQETLSCQLLHVCLMTATYPGLSLSRSRMDATTGPGSSAHSLLRGDKISVAWVMAVFSNGFCKRRPRGRQVQLL